MIAWILRRLNSKRGSEPNPLVALNAHLAECQRSYAIAKNSGDTQFLHHANAKLQAAHRAVMTEELRQRPKAKPPVQRAIGWRNRRVAG